MENLRPLQNLHTDVYRSLIRNCQNLDAAKVFVRRWKDKQTVVHLDNVISFSAKKKWVVKPWKDKKES